MPNMKKGHMENKKIRLMPKMKRSPKPKFCTSKPTPEVGRKMPQEVKLMH